MESIRCQKCGEVCDLAISTTDFSGRYVSTCCGAGYDYMLEVSDMSNINSVYKQFEEWCKSNPQHDLDVRMHSHGGKLENGGYISDEKTRIAFAAYRAGNHQADSKTARIKELREALADLIDIACRCDGWEFFPSDAIESAQAALRP